MVSDEKNIVRKYVNLPESLNNKAEIVMEQASLNFSELLRNALESYIKAFERQKINREIAEACEYYYEIDKKIASEWRETEGKI